MKRIRERKRLRINGRLWRVPENDIARRANPLFTREYKNALGGCAYALLWQHPDEDGRFRVWVEGFGIFFVDYREPFLKHAFKCPVSEFRKFRKRARIDNREVHFALLRPLIKHSDRKKIKARDGRKKKELISGAAQEKIRAMKRRGLIPEKSIFDCYLR